jgi:uncharacterized membrane protein YbaN (DUF454 family)
MGTIHRIKKALWFSLGIIFLGIAYLGTFVPGLPWSTPSLLAAWCFSKSSERFHNYMLNHKIFGPFIKNWRDGRVIPKYAFLAMFLSMDGSLIIMWYKTHNLLVVGSMGLFFALILLWASRYPSSKEEAERRKEAGEKIGWFGNKF